MTYNFDIKIDNGTYTIEVDTEACYGYFEHNTRGDEDGGGLWFESSGGKLQLIDHDGVATLSMKVIASLREADLIVPKDFE